MTRRLLGFFVLLSAACLPPSAAGDAVDEHPATSLPTRTARFAGTAWPGNPPRLRLDEIPRRHASLASNFGFLVNFLFEAGNGAAHAK